MALWKTMCTFGHYRVYRVTPHHQYINQERSLCVCVCHGCDSLPQRVLWERGYNVYRNAYAGNESPNWSADVT